MSNFSDFPLQSPDSVHQNSFFSSSNLTQSPDVYKGNKYSGKKQVSPQSQVLIDFQSPIPHQQKAKYQPNQKKNEVYQDLPKQIEEGKQGNDNEAIDSEGKMDEIQLLKQHLKTKYKSYSDKQLDEIIQKFINEYLHKLKNTNQETQDLSEEEFQDDQSRDSLSTNLDWNDRQQLDKYCQKQKKIQETKDFRPSQYFGAIQVDRLEDGVEDSRIDELFSDCFGIQPKPKQREKIQKQETKAQPKRIQTQNHQGSNIQLNQEVGSNNGTQNDQSCKIILNFYNQFQIMNKENVAKDSYLKQNNKNKEINEEEHGQALKDKSNKSTNHNNCQVLHQESQKSNYQQQSKGSQQDSLKKYMSPSEMNKLKNQKYPSDSMDIENNGFSKCCFKTDDNRNQDIGFAQKKSMNKNSQTQINSPLSQGHINKHLYNQSISNSSHLNLVSSNQILTHQSSMGNLNSTGNNIKGKHQSLLSMNKQTYKNILYKHQNPNYQSISSSSSIENKPKQMNKLSYLVAKNLPGAQQNEEQEQHHCRINSLSTVNSAPKPPQNQTQPITAKNGRDSRDNKLSTEGLQNNQDSFYNESSPKVSPKATLLQQHGQLKTANMNKLSLNTQPFSMQHANSTVSQNCKSILQPYINKENDYNDNLVQSSVDNFKQLHQSVQQKSHKAAPGSSTNRDNKTQKTLGRNQSQNYFKTQGSINGVQSFLLQTQDIKRQISKESVENDGQFHYIDTEEIQNSPIQHSKKYENIGYSQNNTARPQTVINNNFTLNTGINQYMSNANHLGKPPSKMQKGFLSHNSSAKNLKIQSKNLTLNPQTCKASSRKQVNNHYTSVQQDMQTFSMHPQSTRNVPAGYVKFTTKATSLSKERHASSKSNERNKLKGSTIQQKDSEFASLERKRVMYKTNKVNQETQAKFYSGYQKTAQVERKVSNSRNGNNKAKLVTEYVMNPSHQNQEQNSSKRTMLKINKSLDKISSIFMNAPSQEMPQHPQTTKNSAKVAKANEIISQINSYQSIIKKTKTEKEQQSMKHQKAKNTTANSKTRKDWLSTQSSIDGNPMSKKTTETYKKYLSGTQPNLGFNSFK